MIAQKVQMIRSHVCVVLSGLGRKFGAKDWAGFVLSEGDGERRGRLGLGFEHGRKYCRFCGVRSADGDQITQMTLKVGGISEMTLRFKK